MTRLEKAYRFLKGFVYPAFLGAALAWWIQALAVWLSSASNPLSPPPSLWSLWFGAWFVAYECIWYWFLLEKSVEDDKPPEGYRTLSIVTDCFDLLALSGGFIALGFASAGYSNLNAGMVFLAVFVLVLSAAVANARRWWRTATTKGNRSTTFGSALMTYPVPFLVALAVPGWGMYRHLWLGAAMSGADVALLAFLYGLLIAYLFMPSVFSSHRSPGEA